MSYEYFLQAHLNEDSQEIATTSILSIFEKYITAKGDTYIDLQFEENESCTIYMKAGDATVSHLMISRPCGSIQLGKCLYQVMLLGNFVFFEPDGIQPILVTPVAASHLPAGMIESLGTPAIANGLDEFLELYFNNR